MRTGEALHYLLDKLTPFLNDFARPQAEEILQYLLHCSRSELYSSKEKLLNNSQVAHLESILSERLKGKPLQYILGSTFFYSREFRISPDVLIPRPDTEILVERVLSNEKGSSNLFADIGIGSGIIACILTEERPEWRAIGVDISLSALRIAKQNRKTPVLLLCADLLTPFKPLHQFDFLVSNPPYISRNEMNILDPEVKDHEPELALFGGNDGLDFYRRLAQDSKRIVKPGGRIYCEIGYDQEFSAQHIFTDAGWSQTKVTCDFGGNPRVLEATIS